MAKLNRVQSDGNNVTWFVDLSAIWYHDNGLLSSTLYRIIITTYNGEYIL